MLIWKRMKAYASSDGEKIALVCGDTELTYAQFVAKVENVARSWSLQGLQPGDRIALHLRNGCELATCYYACFAAGFVAVPINNRLSPEEIAYVLEHSGARAYLTQPDLRVPTSISLWEPDFNAADADHLVQHDLPLPDADAPALLLYTSGTTARPKGVVHTQRTLDGNASYMETWGLRQQDHTLLFTSMAHASGAIMLLISTLWMGATVTIVPVFEAAAVLDTWEHSGATFYMALPTMVRALMIEQRARPRRITSGRLAICGGDTVPVPLQQEYTAVFGHLLVEGFGMTEGLPMLANRPESNRAGSMGRPLGDLEIRVVDGEMWRL